MDRRMPAAMREVPPRQGTSPAAAVDQVLLGVAPTLALAIATALVRKASATMDG